MTEWECDECGEVLDGYDEYPCEANHKATRDDCGGKWYRVVPANYLTHLIDDNDLPLCREASLYVYGVTTDREAVDCPACLRRMGGRSLAKRLLRASVQQLHFDDHISFDDIGPITDKLMRSLGIYDPKGPMSLVGRDPDGWAQVYPDGSMEFQPLADLAEAGVAEERERYGANSPMTSEVRAVYLSPPLEGPCGPINVTKITGEIMNEIFRMGGLRKAPIGVVIAGVLRTHLEASRVEEDGDD